MNKPFHLALLAAALIGFAAPASADDCKMMLNVLDPMMNKADPGKDAGEARQCAAVAELTGAMKIFRIISDECMPEGERRFKGLAELDRAIRGLTSEIDKRCKGAIP